MTTATKEIRFASYGRDDRPRRKRHPRPGSYAAKRLAWKRWRDITRQGACARCGDAMSNPDGSPRVRVYGDTGAFVCERCLVGRHAPQAEGQEVTR